MSAQALLNPEDGVVHYQPEAGFSKPECNLPSARAQGSLKGTAALLEMSVDGGRALIQKGDARGCGHCWPTEQ